MKAIHAPILTASRSRMLALAVASALLGACSPTTVPDADDRTEASLGNSHADTVRPSEGALGARSRNDALAPPAQVLDASPKARAGEPVAGLTGVQPADNPRAIAPSAPPSGVRPARVGNLRVVSTDP